MAGLTGLEPAASCVTGRRSDRAELQPQILNYYYTLFFSFHKGFKIKQWSRRDLNPRPRECHSRALPLSYGPSPCLKNNPIFKFVNRVIIPS